MKVQPGPAQVDIGEDFYHVRQRNPQKFDRIRIPDWVNKPAQSISKGSQVKMGKSRWSDNWYVQSVLIEKNGKDTDVARSLARRIRQKIEEAT